MKTLIASSEQASTRSLTDMDARLQTLKQKITALEANLDGRISEVFQLNLIPLNQFHGVFYFIKTINLIVSAADFPTQQFVPCPGWVLDIETSFILTTVSKAEIKLDGILL